LACCFFTPLPVFAEPAGTDVVLLIDTSGSMNRTDPNRKVLESAIGLIDMMEGASRVGVVEFSGFIEYTAPLTPISDTDSINEIKREINRFNYFGYTDIGLALKTGAQILLDEYDTLSNPMIILFTDGRIEIGPRQAQVGRTVEKSRGDIAWALSELDGSIPVHTVGLNPGEGLDVPMLNMIAELSTATATFTREAESLPEIFAGIYRRHREAAVTVTEALESPESVDPEWQPPEPEPDLPEPEAPDADAEPAIPEETASAPSVFFTPDEGTDEVEPEPAPERETPDGTPAGNGNWRPNRLLLALSLLFVAVVVGINARWLLKIIYPSPADLPPGYLDIVTVNGDGAPSQEVSVDLDLSSGRIPLKDIVESDIGTDEVYLQKKPRGLLLINDGECEITDGGNAIITKRKILWQENMRLIFSDEDPEDQARVEITYRTENEEGE
jgi:hypothetical protein